MTMGASHIGLYVPSRRLKRLVSSIVPVKTYAILQKGIIDLYRHILYSSKSPLPAKLLDADNQDFYFQKDWLCLHHQWSLNFDWQVTTNISTQRYPQSRNFASTFPTSPVIHSFMRA